MGEREFSAETGGKQKHTTGGLLLLLLGVWESVSGDRWEAIVFCVKIGRASLGGLQAISTHGL